jgi:uncharacterized membrane protein YedE/YeeE
MRLTAAVAMFEGDGMSMGSALLGGVMVGAASGAIVLLLGRVAGITGILAGAWPASGRWWTWRAAFVAGLVLAGAIGGRAAPDAIGATPASMPLAIAAGLLVGFGARYGGGCTSGHGVCGVGRLSRRSIVGTATFVAVAMIVVFVVRHGSVQ